MKSATLKVTMTNSNNDKSLTWYLGNNGISSSVYKKLALNSTLFVVPPFSVVCGTKESGSTIESTRLTTISFSYNASTGALTGSFDSTRVLWWYGSYTSHTFTIYIRYFA